MILVVVGPTGVGKTRLSIELAKKYDAVIVNADSMQVYRGLDIGTAKIKEEEKENIPHFLFDIVNVLDMYTVYDYQRDVRKILELYKDKNIILVGGTGLYIKAALFDYRFNDEDNNTKSYDEYSNDELLEMVKLIDENTLIHANNRKRLVRRLNKDKSDDNLGNNLLYDAKFIGLTTSRDKLYERINERVDEMIDEGLIQEVKSFYDQNIRSKAIMTGIGYKELYQYFDNEISLDEAIDLIKQRTRKYAKRQYTWFNNQMDVKWFDVNFDDFGETINEVIDYIGM